jgi:hypothetical protein
MVSVVIFYSSREHFASLSRRYPHRNYSRVFPLSADGEGVRGRVVPCSRQRPEHGASRHPEAPGDGFDVHAFVLQADNGAVAVFAEQPAGAAGLVVATPHQRAGQAARMHVAARVGVLRVLRQGVPPSPPPQVERRVSLIDSSLYCNHVYSSLEGP